MIDGGTFFVIIFGGIVIASLIIIILWHALHYVLCKKYDALLFREPYFRLTELIVYSSWPLSLFRSMGYIVLLGVPSLAKRRRFKCVTLDSSNEYFLVLLCRIFIVVGVLGILFLLTMFTWAGVSYIFYD